MSTNSCRPTKVGSAVKRVWGTTVAVPLLLAVMPMAAQAQQTDAQTMQEMQNQIQQLQMRVSQMQQKQEVQEQKQAQAAQVQTPSEAKPSSEGFKVGNTTFGMSGYIKLDAAYNFDQNAAPSTGATGIRNGRDDNGRRHNGGERFGMSAKQTRLNITTDTTTGMGDIKGLLQLDLYGGGVNFDHNYKPRVRLAYFTWNNWTIGKNWSTFSDFNYGTTLDFYGPEAQLFRRHAQVRYTFDLANDSTLDVALETPHDQTLNGADNAQKAPDVVVRYMGKTGDLSYQAAALGRYLRGDVIDPDDPSNDRHDAAFGYGLNLGGSYNMPTGTTLMLSSNYGKGDGTYVYDPAGGADAYANSNGSLDTITRYGYIATVSQALTPKVTGNLIWGQGFSPTNEAEYKRNSSLFVNLMYNVVDPLTFGVEYGHLSLTSRDIGTYHTNRMQVSAIYDF